MDKTAIHLIRKWVGDEFKPTTKQANEFGDFLEAILTAQEGETEYKPWDIEIWKSQAERFVELGSLFGDMYPDKIEKTIAKRKIGEFVKQYDRAKENGLLAVEFLQDIYNWLDKDGE